MYSSNQLKVHSRYSYLSYRLQCYYTFVSEDNFSIQCTEKNASDIYILYWGITDYLKGTETGLGYRHYNVITTIT